MPTTETNSLMTASHRLNATVLEANTSDIKEVIGAIHDLTTARPTNSIPVTLAKEEIVDLVNEVDAALYLMR